MQERLDHRITQLKSALGNTPRVVVDRGDIQGEISYGRKPSGPERTSGGLAQQQRPQYYNYQHHPQYPGGGSMAYGGGPHDFDPLPQQSPQPVSQFPQQHPHHQQPPHSNYQVGGVTMVDPSGAGSPPRRVVPVGPHDPAGSLLHGALAAQQQTYYSNLSTYDQQGNSGPLSPRVRLQGAEGGGHQAYYPGGGDPKDLAYNHQNTNGSHLFDGGRPVDRSTTTMTGGNQPDNWSALQGITPPAQFGGDLYLPVDTKQHRLAQQRRRIERLMARQPLTEEEKIARHYNPNPVTMHVGPDIGSGLPFHEMPGALHGNKIRRPVVAPETTVRRGPGVMDPAAPPDFSVTSDDAKDMSSALAYLPPELQQAFHQRSREQNGASITTGQMHVNPIIRPKVDAASRIGPLGEPIRPVTSGHDIHRVLEGARPEEVAADRHYGHFDMPQGYPALSGDELKMPHFVPTHASLKQLHGEHRDIKEGGEGGSNDNSTLGGGSNSPPRRGAYHQGPNQYQGSGYVMRNPLDAVDQYGLWKRNNPSRISPRRRR